MSQSSGPATDGGDICIRQPRLPFQLPKCFHTPCSRLSMSPPPPNPHPTICGSFSFRGRIVCADLFEMSKGRFQARVLTPLPVDTGTHHRRHRRLHRHCHIALLGMELFSFFLPLRTGPASHLVCVLSCLALRVGVTRDYCLSALRGNSRRGFPEVMASGSPAAFPLLCSPACITRG